MDRDTVTQIKIGTHRFGIVDLKKALENMAEIYAEQADDLVAEELLKSGHGSVDWNELAAELEHIWDTHQIAEY